MGFTAVLSYVLSRVAFVGTHVVFAYWLNLFFNDPFNLGLPTLDAKPTLPEGQCQTFIVDNAISNALWFALWWGTHSILARKVVKVALGLWQHPLERPLFATYAWIIWGLNVHYWKPINNCTSWDPLTVPLHIWAISGAVCLTGVLLIVGLLWSLPEHVFGTDRYKYEQGKYPHGKLITTFPYGLVRHPAAAGFLWCYILIPAWTLNHFFLSALWVTFILTSTLFEEGGLTGEDEFGRQYLAYRAKVANFYPTIASIKAFLGIAPLVVDETSSTGKSHAKKKQP